MRRRQIRRTNYNDRFNALSAVEVRTRHFIQLEWERCADVEESFLKLLLAVALVNGGDGNLAEDPLFLIVLGLYSEARRHREYIAELDRVFNTITIEHQVPRPAPVIRRRTFDQLDPRWCYANTRLRVDQLRRLYNVLDLDPMFSLPNRQRVPSEFAFILTFTKLATGATNNQCRPLRRFRRTVR